MMWKMNSMGWKHGWHYGQAQQMMAHMRHHAEDWTPDANGSPDIITSFLNSFAEKMGANVADEITGDKNDG